MNKEEILQEIKKQQEIQMCHRSTTEIWQNASKRIHELIEQLTNKPVKEAWGRKS